MSMKENLVYWAEAVERADNKDNIGALERFSYITEPSARIYYNMAAIYLRQRNIDQAEKVTAYRAHEQGSLLFIRYHSTLLMLLKRTHTWPSPIFSVEQCI